MYICHDNCLFNSDKISFVRINEKDVMIGLPINTNNTDSYTIIIELTNKSSCRLGVFSEDEYCLAKMMMDKIKEGLANNISFLNLDEYLEIWKKKLQQEKEKEKETKNG